MFVDKFALPDLKIPGEISEQMNLNFSGIRRSIDQGMVLRKFICGILGWGLLKLCLLISQLKKI